MEDLAQGIFAFRWLMMIMIINLYCSSGSESHSWTQGPVVLGGRCCTNTEQEGGSHPNSCSGCL